MAMWALLAGVFVIGFFGEILSLPAWVFDLSPFEHTPQVPAAEVTVTPLVLLTAVAAGLIALGVYAFARRDVT
jgi:ABC-2 type transport system permease protein